MRRPLQGQRKENRTITQYVNSTLLFSHLKPVGVFDRNRYLVPSSKIGDKIRSNQFHRSIQPAKSHIFA